MLAITELIIPLAICVATSWGGRLYEIYNDGGVVNAQGPALRKDQGPQFKLNGKPFHILGGSIQYFRLPPEYWRDRMRKLKALGANTVETVTPWNLHEPQSGQFDFAGKLNLTRFLEIAQEEDLFVILRPGPYICAEWEFGGFPSWLLRNTGIKVRTSDPIFTSAVQSFFEKLISQFVNLQFTKGGSIIMVQVENEYGSFGINDQNYLTFLQNMLQQHDIVELLASSDSCSTDQCRQQGTIPGLLMTANFQTQAKKWLNQLSRLQPDTPLMVMEFWTGWFDYWGGYHSVVNVDAYEDYLKDILDCNASLVMYIFAGGTSFGLMNGANTEQQLVYLPIVNSYDYDAPLSEWGGYTPKYNATKRIFQEFSQGKFWDVPLPALPPEPSRRDYGELYIEKYLSLEDLLALSTPQISQKIIPMELLDLYNNAGQSYGFIVYQTSITVGMFGSELTIHGRVRDYAEIYVDDTWLASFTWYNPLPIVIIPGTLKGIRKLKIIVENCGRVNYGSPNDFTFDSECKGLKDSVTLNLAVLSNWSIYSLDFNQNYTNGLSGAPWKTFSAPDHCTYPALLATTLTINQPPQDTFISTQGWSKGIVIVNQVVLSRYWNVGPQKTLYLPAPLLIQGENKIYIFELGGGMVKPSGKSINLTDTPNLGPPLQHNDLTFYASIFPAILNMLIHT